MGQYVIVGRGPDCNLVLAEPSVSTRHARLSWRNGLVRVEDLASANGTYIGGKRIQDALVRPGDEVRLGTVALPWARPELKPFLRLGAQGTAIARPTPVWRRILRVAGAALAWLVGGASVAVLVALLFPAGREAIRRGGERAQALFTSMRPATSDHEAYVRSRMATRVRDAIDSHDPETRDAAVRVAARQQGTFRVEQVAAIWQHVRGRWRYVNDPQGREFFATARQSIANGYAGDCDDFAITLAAMVGAIGGETRVVIMEGPQGGHAYTEACIHEDASTVATKLARYYGRDWARYTPRGRPGQIHFRTTDACPVWLNLDWFSNVPGGEYSNEQWAVAIYPDGHTETLSTAAGTRPVAGGGTTPRALSTPPAE